MATQLIKYFQEYQKDMTRRQGWIPADLLINILKSPVRYDSNIPCSIAHPNSSCGYQVALMVGKWTKSVWKLYLFAQVLPIILFKRKEFRKRPLMYLWRILTGFGKSLAFILMHGVMTSLILCKTHTISTGGTYNPISSGLIMMPHTASIFLESPGRMEEIMLWVLPRFFAQTWNFLKKTKLVPGDLPYFENLIFGLSIGLLVQSYMHDSKNMKSKYKMIGSLLTDSGEENKIERETEELKYKFGQTIKDSITRAETDSVGTSRTVKTWA